MKRNFYPRPPIAEAIVSFRFSPEVSELQLFTILEAKLGSAFSDKPVKQDKVVVKTTWNETAVSTSTERSHHITYLKSKDGLRLIGCADGMLSIHVVAPYPGWESFRSFVSDALTPVSHLLEQDGLNQIAVRYIDHIHMPVDAKTSFNDLLTVMPAKPESMPGHLSGFHFMTQTRAPSDGTIATLTLVSGRPDSSGLPVVIYDLSTQRDGTPLCAANSAEWLPIVESLHECQRNMFEDSITDQLRESFK